MNRILGDGYSDEFKMAKHGLRSKERHRIYRAQDIKTMSFIRFEENTDPAENVIIYIIDTIDGTKGTLVNNSPDSHEFIMLNYFAKEKEVSLESMPLPVLN